MKIKICGLFREEDIIFANELRPDFIGFVFAASKREIDINKAYKLKKILIDSIKVVGVFVNSPKTIICDIINDGIIDAIQLHGKENELYINELKNLCNAPIIKASLVQTMQDINIDTIADYVLYDGGGGSGLCFDWSLLNKCHRPYFLAGGINESNIMQAIELNPYAIDVSSGVETKGIKDFNKMEYIIRTIRENSI